MEAGLRTMAPGVSPLGKARKGEASCRGPQLSLLGRQLQEGRHGVCPAHCCVPAASRNDGAYFWEPGFSGTTWTPVVSAQLCQPPPFSGTNLNSSATQALLSSVMNKILANALQREKEGARNPPEGGSWNKARQLREAKTNKCII